jgi:hypothetical protein
MKSNKDCVELFLGQRAKKWGRATHEPPRVGDLCAVCSKQTERLRHDPIA